MSSLLESYPVRNESCAFRVIDDKALIVRVAGGEGNRVFSLNHVGTAIWKLADGRKTLSEIADAMEEDFDIASREELEQDLQDFLEELTERDLMTVSEEPS